MNNKILITIFTVLLIVLSVSNYSSRSAINIMKNKDFDLKIKNAYLERCLNYSVLLDRSSFQPFDKDIILYYSGEACASCIEDFLLYYKKNNGIQNRLLVITDSEDKLVVPMRFNDAFNANFEYIYDSVKMFKVPINEVIVFKVKDGEIKSLLEYRPEEETLFSEYFQK